MQFITIDEFCDITNKAFKKLIPEFFTSNFLKDENSFCLYFDITDSDIYKMPSQLSKLLNEIPFYKNDCKVKKSTFVCCSDSDDILYILKVYVDIKYILYILKNDHLIDDTIKGIAINYIGI